MKSPGGKIEWLCPLCKSGDIAHMTFHGQDSGECYSCNTWWPWKSRFKVSIKKQRYIDRRNMILGINDYMENE